MNYRVIYAPSFRDDLARQLDFLRAERVPDDIIERWFDRLFERVDQLSQWPNLYPVDERLSRELGFDVRKLIHGNFVITYQVDDEREGIHLLAMVHGARRK
jgi:plasmid stabilization system protein ParE